MFGRSLAEQAEADGQDVPVIVSKCILAVEDNGMEYEGALQAGSPCPRPHKATDPSIASTQASTASRAAARSPNTSRTSLSAAITRRSTSPIRTRTVPVVAFNALAHR